MDATPPNPEVPALVADPGVLTAADKLKHYQEGRTDVRSYAGFLIQVVTLLLTSMIIVIGWVAKDYATEKYRIAIQATAPQLAAGSPGALSNSQKQLSSLARPEANKRIEGIESELDYVSSVYRHILIFSPTTSLILGAASFFTLVILAMLIILTYQLQRRRYHYHALGNALGLEPDQPIMDPVLTQNALNLFIVVMGIVALLLLVLTFSQTVIYVFHRHLSEVTLCLIVMLILLAVKTYSVIVLVVNYSRFEKKEGWKARWMRARILMDRIMEVAKPDHADSDEKLQSLLKNLKDICDAGGKSRWTDAKGCLISLRDGLHDTTLGGQIGDIADELAITLKYGRVMRRKN